MGLNSMYYCIAMLLIAITISMMIIAIRKGVSKLSVIMFGLIMVLLLSNSAVYVNKQLANPMIVPLVYDFYSDNDTHDFAIHYITNKSDYRKVEYLQAGDVTLWTTSTGDKRKGGYFYYSSDVVNETAHQFMRAAYFSANTTEIQKLLQTKKVYLVLNDGEKLATSLSLKWDDSNQRTVRSIRVSGSSNGEHSTSFESPQDTQIDAVNIPACLKRHTKLLELRVNEVAYTEKDFPISVKKGQIVYVSFQTEDSGLDIHAKVSVSGSDAIWPVWIDKKAVLDIQKIKEERQRYDCDG
ncbi:hypothetical protein [Lysinibacillus sp. FW12]|uniref:hypothetical protein n=1 Tax=Lysinibacillus sp. FW12 TaxID=3096079 RepID=UPI003D718CD5